MILEAILAAALLALALVVALRWGARSGRRGRAVAVAVWLAACAALAWAALGPWAWRARAVRPPTNRPLEVAEGGYVSSRECRACHPDQYASWYASYHRRMTQVATPETVVAPFEDTELELYGDVYRLSREDGRFWVDMHGRWEPGTPPRVRKPVVMTTGSHHYQLYWLPTGQGRLLELFGFAWRIDEARWMPVDAIFLYPPEHRQIDGTKGHWNATCSRCHATLPQPRLVGSTADTRAAEFGIACEACHGPGEQHVLANRNPLRRWTQHLGEEPDDTIVQPERLAPERASQVCGQCHGVLPFRDEFRESYVFHGPRYRPGGDLAETRVVMKGGPADRFWSDGMNRTSGREWTGLIQTPCYTHGDPARGVLTCMSCHELHPDRDDPRPLAEWADDQLAPGMQGNAACLQCHPRFAAQPELAAHTHHAAESSGSVCYDCHMPHTSYGLLKAIRSHTLDSPTVQATLATGRPNACNLCHLDRPLGWTADHLTEWYGTPRPELSTEQETIAAGPLWTLTGDAGQRALVAWSMGWAPAREASGDGWMEPYLAQLLVDPYAAARFIAWQALKKREAFADFAFDSAGPAAAREAARDRARTLWSHTVEARERNDAVLIGPEARLDEPAFQALLEQRNDRPVGLLE